MSTIKELKSVELHTEIGANLHLATLDAVQCTSFALHIDKAKNHEHRSRLRRVPDSNPESFRVKKA